MLRQTYEALFDILESRTVEFCRYLWERTWTEGLWWSRRRRKTSFTSKATFIKLESFKPKPPYCLGIVSVFQQTKCIGRHLLQLLQTKLRVITLMELQTVEGIQRTCIEWTGMQAKTDLAKQTLPALLSNLPFHDAGLDWILSKIPAKVDLVTLSFINGKPKYLPRY